MADTLRIKRRAVGGAAGAPASLAAAEIAYNEVDDTLYYGKGNSGGLATNVIPIAGPGSFQPLDADLTSLAAASAIGALYYRSAANTWAVVTVGTGLSFTTGTLAATGAAKTGFSAYSGGQTGVASETWTKVQFNTTSFNDSTLYSTTNHRWTPPAGRCQLSAAVFFFSGVLIGTPVGIAIYKNGTLIRQTTNACVLNSAGTAAINVIEACSGTDYFEVFTLIYSSTTGSIFGSSTTTYFMGTSL